MGNGRRAEKHYLLKSGSVFITSLKNMAACGAKAHCQEFTMLFHSTHLYFQVDLQSGQSDRGVKAYKLLEYYLFSGPHFTVEILNAELFTLKNKQ